MTEQREKDAAEPPLDCRVMPLAAQLRAHANSKSKTVAWEGHARMLMEWAADTIDAANEALRDNVEAQGRLTAASSPAGVPLERRVGPGGRTCKS